jgi:hypothetical protein
MDDSLQKQIETRFRELPADVQRAIQSSNVDQKVQELGKKHTLHLDQIGELGNEIYLVMLGFSDPKNMADELAQRLKLPADKAEALAQDISAALFVPIRESMQKFAEERTIHAAILEQSTPPPAAPAPTKPAEKAFVVPVASAASVQAPPTPKPTPMPPVTVTPAPLASVTPPAPTPKAPEIHPADMLLSQKTVTVAPKPVMPPAPPPAVLQKPPAAPQNISPATAVTTPAAAPAKNEPPAPKPYTADPYREPIDGK